MKKNQDISKREKGAAVGLVISFVAMIAIVGMITFSQYQRKLENEQLAKAQTKEEEENFDVIDSEEDNQSEKEPSQITNTDKVQAELQKPSIEEENNAEIISAPVQTDTLVFSASDVLSWPVDGNVILSYSMDETIYFSTLDQYKYNPAIVISGEVGTEVLAAADGVVEKIEVTAQTGTTITMSLGNGYQLVYGQLKEVSLKEGDRVEKGEVVGYLSEPTKYYSVEGPNLYFELLKDSQPVNPMEYMEA